MDLKDTGHQDCRAQYTTQSIFDRECTNFCRFIAIGLSGCSLWILLGTTPLLLCAQESVSNNPASESASLDLTRFFENEIRPILSTHCLDCHSAEFGDVQGGLDLGSKFGLSKGGDSGKVIDLAMPEESLLLDAIRYENRDLQMPPEGRLPEKAIASLEKWVMQGAYDPRSEEQPENGREEFDIEERIREHWAWWPIRSTVPVEVKNQASQNRIDQFIDRALVNAELRPSRRASPETILRRLHFDLAGIPPTIQQLERFQARFCLDPDLAIEQDVNELLLSPRFGEHWATMWLDLFRFSETKGHVTDQDRPFAWKYRDYVINAFNDDLPYNRFVIEHIAGDLLEGRDGRSWGDQVNVSPTATGALFMHEMHFMSVDPVQQRWDEINAQVDVVGKAFLGLTTECARCHDHKFDAISQADYYALAGFFLSTEQGKSRTAPRQPVGKAVVPALSKAETAYRTFLEQKVAGRKKAQSPKVGDQYFPISEELGVQSPNDTARLYQLMDEISSLDSSWPNWVRSAREAEGRDAKLLVRGNYKNTAGPVPRRFLEALGGEPLPEEAKAGSGRLWLAKRITDEKNPLVARVWANRIWQQMFGTGIVETASNFGKNGVEPSNLELLDYLAYRLIDLGWSTKALVREIVLSNAYQRESIGSSSSKDSELKRRAMRIDPKQKLLAFRSKKRLAAEQIRDALLVVSESLDPRIGGESVDAFVPSYATANKPSNVPKSGPLDGDGRRAVYLKVRRNFPDPFLSKFDFPDRGKSSSNRTMTEVPSQSLAMMNSGFVHLMAQNWGAKIAVDRSLTDEQKIRQIWQAALGRSANPEEIDAMWDLLEGLCSERGLDFRVNGRCVDASIWADMAHVIFNHPEFLWLD